MKNKTYIRLFLLAVIMVSSLILFSYTRNTDPAPKKECCNEKCEQKTQSDFIIWESISRNLLSSR
jgi:hypothetical protein